MDFDLDIIKYLLLGIAVLIAGLYGALLNLPLLSFISLPLGICLCILGFILPNHKKGNK